MQRTTMSLVSTLVLVAVLTGFFGAQPAHAVTGREPVIIIPGVAGSEFTATSAFNLSVDNGHGGTYTRSYSAGEKVWVNTWEAAIGGEDDYFDALKLKADGLTPVAPALKPSGVYASAYSDLIDYLRGQGYTLNVDLWLFPYDWRRDLRLTHADLDALIRRALIASNGGRSDPATWTIKRADLVGHSMGGMVGRTYVSDPARASRVDQLITLGSPQLGAVKFLKALMYGDQFGPSFLGIGLNPNEVKDIVQNSSGGMQLLPSRAYYTYYDNSDSSRRRPWVEDRDIDGDGVARGVLGYDGVKQVLLNSRKNGTVIGMAEAYHDGIDGGRHGGVNGVRWAALVGYGSGTLGQMREYTGSCWSWYRYVPCPKRDELVVDGDGTVAVMSAAMGDPWRGTLIASGAQVWYVQREHGALVQKDSTLGITTGDGPSLTWIGDLLRGTIAMSAPTGSVLRTENAIQTTKNGATRVPQGKLSGIQIAALGPVALEVRDEAGRTTGRGRNTDTGRNDAPNTRYDRGEGGEFVVGQRDTAYTLDLAAEHDGSLDLKVRVLGNGNVERTAIYLGVGLRVNGRARLEIGKHTGRANSPNAWPKLAVDADGDGAFEAQITAAATLDAAGSADTTAPMLTVNPIAAGRGTAMIAWQAADNGAGLYAEHAVIDADSAAPRTVRNGETVALAPGEHRLLVVAVDRAGNATSHEAVFVVN